MIFILYKYTYTSYMKFLQGMPARFNLNFLKHTWIKPISTPATRQTKYSLCAFIVKYLKYNCSFGKQKRCNVILHNFQCFLQVICCTSTTMMKSQHHDDMHRRHCRRHNVLCIVTNAESGWLLETYQSNSKLFDNLKCLLSHIPIIITLI